MTDKATQVQLAQFARRFMDLLDGSLKNLVLYPPDHPIVVESVKQIEYHLADLFLLVNEVTLSVVDGEFYLNDHPLKRESLDFPKLRAHLEERAATSLSFSTRVSATEIHVLLSTLARPPEELEAAGGIRLALASEGVANARVGRAVSLQAVPSRLESVADDPELGRRIAAAREDYSSAVSNMQDIFADMAGAKHVNYRAIKLTAESLIDSVVRNVNVWSQLLNIKHYDDYTYNHSVNVATVALLIASRFGMLPDRLSVLGEAALLHDIGKVKVPLDVIRKEGALSDEEWAEIRSHPERGAKILLNTSEVTEGALMVAYEHHVRFDCKGYPRVQGKRDLHLFSHIVSVADIYDALTSDRPYRRALLPDMAVRILLSQSGTAFHPLVVKVFLNMVGLYPVGTHVKLKSGEIALVRENNTRDLLRPRIEIVLNRDGSRAEPRERDLMAEPGLEPPVECSVDPTAHGLQGLEE